MKINRLRLCLPSLSAIATIATFLAPLAAYPEVSLPYSTSFLPEERYEQGNLDGQNGWLVLAGEGVVIHLSQDESVAVLDADGLPAWVELDLAANREDVIYLSLDSRPVADEDLLESTLIDLEVAALRFKQVGDRGHIHVLHGYGDGGTGWLATDTSFPLLPGGIAAEDLSLTLRLDFGQKLWDLWLGKILEDTEVGFYDTSHAALERVLLIGHSLEVTELSSLRISSEPPAFLGGTAQADDAEGSEPMQGDLWLTGESTVPQRLGTALPGLKNVFLADESDNATSPDDQEANVGVIYVDNYWGSDFNSGYAAIPGTNGGPKATIQAAARVAGAGEQIIIKAGASPYHANVIPPGTILTPGVRIDPQTPL